MSFKEALIALIDEIIVITVVIIVILGMLFAYGVIDLTTVITVLAAYGIIVFSIGYKIAKTQLTKPKVGHETLIGAKGYVVEDIRGEGMVFVEGELWRARSANGSYITKGSRIEVIDVKGLILVVKKVER